jgi:lipopolysaccharide export system permease protein
MLSQVSQHQLAVYHNFAGAVRSATQLSRQRAKGDESVGASTCARFAHATAGRITGYNRAMKPLMSGITRYIFRQLALATVLVSIALALIVWLTQSLQFLQFIVSKGLSVTAWLKLTVLLLPSFLLTILPAALFFVVLFTYNKLTADRELVVAQAAGISQARLAAPVLVCASLATFVGFALSLWIVPMSVSAFKDVQWLLRSDASQILLREGSFNELTQGLTVYIRARGRDGQLSDIMVHDARPKDGTMTLLAAQGIVTNDNDRGMRIVLSNGSRQELKRGTTQLSVSYFDSYAFSFADLGKGPTARDDTRDRSTWDLMNAQPGDKVTPGNAARMRAEGHERLVGPVNVFSYAFLALAFLLTGPFDKRGQTRRLVLAIGTAIVFQAAALGALSVAGNNSLFIPLMYVVTLLPIGVGLYMIGAPDRRLRRFMVPKPVDA